MAAIQNTELRALPPRERTYILIELAAITLLAWLYLVKMPMTPSDLGALVARLAAPLPSAVVDFWLTFMMWAVMMVAMMLPSASPMILTYARIARGRTRPSLASVRMFALGYVAVWTAFSAAATLAQAALLRAAIITSAVRATPMMGAAILVATGIYQFTPWKTACLSRCQSPVAFFMTRWRDGPLGAFQMGLRHGAFCVGCCWMLMSLLFVAGAMNLAWVAVITGFVLLEKLIPYPRALACSAGLVLIASGLIVFVRR